MIEPVLLGSVAAVLTTGSFGFQVWKIIQTKRTEDISWMMYAILLLGVSLWLWYGLSIGELPVILANAVTLLFVVSVLLLKWRYEKLKKVPL